MACLIRGAYQESGGGKGDIKKRTELQNSDCFKLLGKQVWKQAVSSALMSGVWFEFKGHCIS